MDEYMGTVKAFGFGFTPRGWLPCDGQLLAITQYTALFSLLGTIYGGDGRTTFGLPDLRGYAPIGDGTGPGLTPRPIGAKGGSETNILNANQLPAHSHTVDFSGQSANAKVDIPALNDEGTLEETENNVLANHTGAYAASSAADTSLGSFSAPLVGTVQSTSAGASQPVNNMQPFLAVNYCICVEGIYPPRS